MESTQLLIKMNHAMQSNKDLYQKTNIIANANSKSFDQILSIFNLIQFPTENEIIEHNALTNNINTEETNFQDSNHLSEEDWLELDSILQEMFGLYHQLYSYFQSSNDVEEISLLINNTDDLKTQLIQQGIDEVQGELTQWLQNMGRFKQLSNNETSQLIEKIAKYTNEFTKLDRNSILNKNSQLETTVMEFGDTHSVKEQLNYLSDSRMVNEKFNTLEKLLNGYGITIPVEKMVNSVNGIINSTVATTIPMLPNEPSLFTNILPTSNQMFINKFLMKNNGTKYENTSESSNVNQIQNELSQVNTEALTFDKQSTTELINGIQSETLSTSEDYSKIESTIHQIETEMKQINLSGTVLEPKNNYEKLTLSDDSKKITEGQQHHGIVDENLQSGTVSKITVNTVTQLPHSYEKLTLSDFVPEVSHWMGRFIKISKDQTGSSEIKFSMYPEHLGHLEIKIAALKGQITAQIITDTLVAKESLDGQVSMLKHALQQQGLQVQKIEIIQYVPTTSELNDGNNPSFSQGGSNQQHFNHSNEQSGYNSSKPVINTAEEEDGTMLNGVEKQTTAYTYGGNQVRTATRIDFSA